ncbi:MKROS protein, partial [Grallaria varia]|nr:MKROS protein [Grallaria varia]
SPGVVYHYEERGVQRARQGWEQCLCVPLLRPHAWDLQRRWDGLLERFSRSHAWQPRRYDEQEHNCYTYALAFINHVRSLQGQQPLSKDEFTERFVMPQTRRASRYLTLHHQLAHRDFYMVPLPEQEEED